MHDITLAEMTAMQRALHEKHAEDWSPLVPETARSTMLWMVEELGECAAIIKKKGDAAIMENPKVRAAFTEEMCDVLMYYLDVMQCYGITPEALGRAFRAKHEANMRRDYAAREKAFLAE